MEENRQNRRQNSIYRKIMRLFLMVILLLAVCGSVVVWVYLHTSYRSRILDMAGRELARVTQALSDDTEELLHVSYTLQNDAQINTIFGDDREKSIEEQYRDMWTLDNALNNVLLPLSIEPVSLYVPDDAIYAGNNMVYRREAELKDYPEYEELRSSSEPFAWLAKDTLYQGFDHEKEYISFLRKIGPNNEPVGYMRVNIQVDSLREALKNICILSGEMAVLYSYASDEIIACTDNTSQELQAYLAEDGHSHALAGGFWKSVTVPGIGRLCLDAQTVSAGSWTVISIIPERILRRDIGRMLLMWLLVIACVSMIALHLAAGISGSITGRIQKLERNMGNLAKGHFEQMQEDAQEDEISDLIRHYNIAIRQMIDLHEKRYDAMKKLQGARLTILQSQINPHFLYNTLDLIHWEAMDAHAESISQIVHSLADFYRLSLNDGRELVSIRDEIRHVISYLEIIDQKYRDKIDYEIEIPAEMYENLIPRITLQPLVENAVLHGLLEKEDMAESQIEIYGWKQEKDLFIQISDNGAGMSADRMNRLLEPEAPGRGEAGGRHGFGVRNIHERLRLLYGGEYGLSFTGSPGEGTTVLVKFADHVMEHMREEWQHDETTV